MTHLAPFPAPTLQDLRRPLAPGHQGYTKTVTIFACEFPERPPGSRYDPNGTVYYSEECTRCLIGMHASTVHAIARNPYIELHTGGPGTVFAREFGAYSTVPARLTASVLERLLLDRGIVIPREARQ